MKKIVGFRLPLRLPELQRRAKKAGLALGSDGGAALREEALRLLKPAVLYDSFPRPGAEERTLSPLPGLAYSLILVTLGEGFASRLRGHGAEAPDAGPWPVVQEAALQEALRFATGLLEPEAAEEACELSPLSLVADPAELEAALRLLAPAKIGVSFADGRLVPEPTRLYCLSWVPKSKAKKKQGA